MNGTEAHFLLNMNRGISQCFFKTASLRKKASVNLNYV